MIQGVAGKVFFSSTADTQEVLKKPNEQQSPAISRFALLSLRLSVRETSKKRRIEIKQIGGSLSRYGKLNRETVNEKNSGNGVKSFFFCCKCEKCA